MTELRCTVCNTRLDPAFEGKAEARDWDMSVLTCTDHFGEVNGAHLVPTA